MPPRAQRRAWPGRRARMRLRARVWWPCLAALACSSVPVAASPPDLRELVEVADISALSASPDGRLVAFRIDRPSIEKNSYDLAWHVLDTATGRVRRIAAGGEPILYDPGLLAAEAPIWSQDGRWIYYRALRAEAVQIWRAAADGSGAQAVTAEEGDVQSVAQAVDGRGLVYRVGPPRREIEQAEMAEYESGILVDEHVELAQNLFRGAIVNGRRATQRIAGGWFSRGNVLWHRPPRERRLDFATLRTADASREDFPPTDVPGVPEPEALARSSGGDAAAASWDGVRASLQVARRGGASAMLSCHAAECRAERISWLAWRPGRDQIVFATIDRAQMQTLRLWDLATAEVRTLMRANGNLSGGPDESSPCAIGTDEAVCVLAEPTSPPRLETIDLASGAGRPVHDPNVPLRSRRWPWTERLTWRSAEGREFTAVLFLPEMAPPRPLPLFINYYRCGGFLRGGVGDEWPVALLAAHGIASVCVNATRMSGPQDGVGQYRAALAGIEVLVDVLVNRGFVDRRRVGMGGLSFGTEVTLWTLIHSDLISAASIASPQLEASSYWINGVRGRDHHETLRRVWGLGAPEETPERWQLLSAALNTGSRLYC